MIFLEKCIKEKSQLIIINGAKKFDCKKLMEMDYIYLVIGAVKINSMY